MSESYKQLLEGNKEWVAKTLELSPDFFNDLAKGQQPEFLWIGCSDSRVPATEITKMVPGSIFVHRNIANMVIHTDSNLLSVVYYAVKVLKVKHVIVCGHYGCGGVKAAMGNDDLGYLNNWVSHIKDVYRLHQNELDGIKDEDSRFDRFVELNVQEQVMDLSKVSFMQDEWKERDLPHIHGWVYSLSDGLIKDLGISVKSIKDVDKFYQFN